MQSQFIKDLITLPGFLIHGERKEGERWIFELSLPPHCPICPTCFGRTTKISSKRKQWIHGYPNTVGLFWIELPIERRRCQACFLTFTVSYPGLPSHRIATESFQHWVAQLCIGKTIQEVARLLQLAYTTVERWFYQYAPALLPTSNPTVVCVDEFAFRKGHDYGVAVMDTQTRNVLSIASGKNEEAIVEALQPVASKVKYVVSDLAPAMRKAIEKVCPKAIHVLDHFHVIQLFTDALERCRKYLAKGGTKHGSVRRVCRWLSQRPEKLTEEERQEVRQWCQESAYLRDVYQALQHFRYVSKSQTRKQAETRLTQWFDRYLFSDCAAVRSIAKALITRRDAVLSCIVFSYSNGPMEGINNKIKLIKRRGYGYRNIQRFTLRVRLETSITF